MKKPIILLLIIAIYGCSVSTEENEWIFYYNFEDTEQEIWDLNTLLENPISIEEFNSFDLEKLDLNESKLITDETVKDKLCDLIPFTKWVLDSISYDPIGLASPINKEHWLYFEKKRLKEKTNLYSLGNIEFVSGIKSVLVAKQDSDDKFYSHTILCINIDNNRVVSIVEMGDYADFISLSVQHAKSTPFYNKRKKKCIIDEKMVSLFMTERDTTERRYAFRFDSRGMIVSKVD